MCKATELVSRISAAERKSLKQMGTDPLWLRPPGQRIPGRQEEKLIGLGLAELVFGEIDLTITGRRALGLIAA